MLLPIDLGGIMVVGVVVGVAKIVMMMFCCYCRSEVELRCECCI